MLPSSWRTTQRCKQLLHPHIKPAVTNGAVVRGTKTATKRNRSKACSGSESNAADDDDTADDDCAAELCNSANAYSPPPRNDIWNCANCGDTELNRETPNSTIATQSAFTPSAHVCVEAAHITSNEWATLTKSTISSCVCHNEFTVLQDSNASRNYRGGRATETALCASPTPPLPLNRASMQGKHRLYRPYGEVVVGVAAADHGAGISEHSFQSEQPLFPLSPQAVRYCNFGLDSSAESSLSPWKRRRLETSFNTGADGSKLPANQTAAVEVTWMGSTETLHYLPPEQQSAFQHRLGKPQQINCRWKTFGDVCAFNDGADNDWDSADGSFVFTSPASSDISEYEERIEGVESWLCRQQTCFKQSGQRRHSEAQERRADVYDRAAMAFSKNSVSQILGLSCLAPSHLPFFSASRANNVMTEIGDDPSDSAVATALCERHELEMLMEYTHQGQCRVHPMKRREGDKRLMKVMLTSLMFYAAQKWQL